MVPALVYNHRWAAAAVYLEGWMLEPSGYLVHVSPHAIPTTTCCPGMHLTDCMCSQSRKSRAWPGRPGGAPPQTIDSQEEPSAMIAPQNGDVIGLLLDLDARILVVYRNGQRLGLLVSPVVVSTYAVPPQVDVLVCF